MVPLQQCRLRALDRVPVIRAMRATRVFGGPQNENRAPEWGPGSEFYADKSHVTVVHCARQ